MTLLMPSRLPSSIDNSEMLARFIRFSDWIRADKTVRSNAFIPPRSSNLLSVFRHLRLLESEIWGCGKIAVGSTCRLHGRADIKTEKVRSNPPLDVIAAPKNHRNHAHIANWPNAKDECKLLAQKLASETTFVESPV